MFRAQRINRLGEVGNETDGQGLVFDRSLERDITGMLELSQALRAGDGPAVTTILDRSPRWLRRMDTREAFRYVRERHGASQASERL